MKQITTIGSIIENEVRRKQLDITEVAKLLNTSRNNVYNIFKRNDFKINHLREISQALNHNFFRDLATNPDLACPVPIDEEELNRLRAVNQFLEVVPEIFEKKGIDITIILGSRKEKEIPFPDFILSKYNLSFTIGETFEERSNGFWGEGIAFHHIFPEPASKMVGYINQVNGIQYWDIAIDYKTEEEWEETIDLALEAIHGFYLPRTWSHINQL